MDLERVITSIPGYNPHDNSDGYKFVPKRAQYAITFMENFLRLWEGEHAGKPFVLLNWQRAVIANLFGWVNNEGIRRYTECFIYIAKKNGKSPFAGAILDYMLIADKEPGAQIYCAACDTEQANIIYRNARNLATEEIQELWIPYESTRTLKVESTHSFARVLSSEAKTKDGINASCVLIDEIHRFDNRELVDILEASLSSRRQPLLIFTTTADSDRPSICNEKYRYAKAVQAGKINDARFLPVIYELKPDEDWTNPELWPKANPALGVTKSFAYMKRQLNKAQNEPSYQNTFRRLECNQLTETATAWLEPRQWDQLDELPSMEELEDARLWLGLDLSTTTDLAALGYCWELPDGRIGLDADIWIPEGTAQRKIKADKVPYDVWHRQGHLSFTNGDSVDYNAIYENICAIFERFNVQDLGSDPWNASYLLTRLQEEQGFPVLAFRQGFASMSPACKEFERRFVDKTICHSHNPVIRWTLGNLMIQMDPSGNIKPDKAKSSHRIDPMVAIIMAVGRAALSMTTQKQSIYETRGPKILLW